MVTKAPHRHHGHQSHYRHYYHQSMSQIQLQTPRSEALWALYYTVTTAPHRYVTATDTKDTRGTIRALWSLKNITDRATGRHADTKNTSSTTGLIKSPSTENQHK